MGHAPRWAIALALSVIPVTSLIALAEAGDSAHSDSALSYVALGDSITRARYDDSGGFVQRYVAHLEADLQRPVTVTNLGMGGWTSGDLQNALQTNESLRSAVAQADVLTVFIGANDFVPEALNYLNGTCGGMDNENCLRDGVAAYREHLPSILEEVAALNANPHLVVRLCENYYPTQREPTAHPAYPVLMGYLRQLNETIHEESARRGYEIAEVFSVFNGDDGTHDPFAKGYLAPDAIHPSAAGFDQIAAILRDTGYAPLLEPNMPGDANCDGTVSSEDAMLVLQFDAGIVPLLECDADVNRDGMISSLDAMVVLQYSASLLTSLHPETSLHAP